MSKPIDYLLKLLDLAPGKDDVFMGSPSHERHVRTFGGHVAAQALAAACNTVPPERPVHSLHSYFLRPGNPDEPIAFEVERVRDGRSFTTRRVEGIQSEEPIFQLSASFHDEEVGVEHSEHMPDVVPPDDLAPFSERVGGRSETDLSRWLNRALPFDIRYVEATPFDPPEAEAPTAPIEPAQQRVWVRTAQRLPDDPMLHRCVITYASDMTVLDSVLLTHGMRWTDRDVMGASLDHAMWFHQPFRADEWLLFDQSSPVAHGGRGLARIQIWTRDGRLAVSVVQEALLRPPGQRPSN